MAKSIIPSWLKAILTVIFALLHIASFIAVVYLTDYYYYYIYMWQHFVVCFGSLILSTAFGLALFRGRRKKFKLNSFLLAILLILIVMFFVGIKQYIVAIVVDTVVIAVLLLTVLFLIFGKKGIIGAVAGLLVGVCFAYPFYFVGVAEVNNRTQTVPLVTADDPELSPYGKQASTVYVCNWHTTLEDPEEDKLSNYDDQSYSTYTLFKSIQGYLSLTSDEQMYYYYEQGSEEVHIDLIERYYDTKVVRMDNKYDALDLLAHKIKNYILCDDDMESITVGTSLCNQMDAILLPQDKLYLAKKYGWTEVFNTIGKDKEWLMTSKYFDNLNKNLTIVSVAYISSPTLIDYAIVSNAWFVTQFDTEKELVTYCKKMNRGFRLWGTRYSTAKEVSENAMVAICAKYSGTYFYSWGQRNLSVMTGFRLENAKNIENPITREVEKVDYSTQSVENVHTVCIMFSDGDNMQYCYENNLTNTHQFASPARSEETPATYGMSGLMIELTPIVILAYYERMYPGEGLAMALSSVGYTYPSKWKDEEAFDEVLKSLNNSMKVADIHVVEIMDDISFLNAVDIPVTFDTMQPYFDKYTALDQVEGCLFIGYQTQYRGYKGEMCWSNDKPIVSARYATWNDDEGPSRPKTDLPYISEQINNASRDVTSEDAYSFIIMHAWSGINEDGELVAGGDCMEVITKLSEMFDDDVEIVGCDEFINRIKNNVKR